jgi:putative membrane protein
MAVDLVIPTIALRPYVFAFLLVFLAMAWRDLGLGRALGWLLLGFGIAFTAEYASTRIGFPFGIYHYTGATEGREVFLSNVPFFDPLSFPFLAYASWCVARSVLRKSRGLGLVLLSGALMMLLDVVIDPLAVRGERWFLGHLFDYPTGGSYFGVPLANFGGWLLVGSLIVGGFLAVSRREPLASPSAGVGLYYGVLAFNLALTLWIGEGWLLACGAGLHVVVGLALWAGQRGILGAARPFAWASTGLGVSEKIEGRTT